MENPQKTGKGKRPLTHFSHDIRTPLAIMRLNIDLIKESADFDNVVKMRRFVKAMDRDIERIIKVLSDYKR